MKTSFSRGIFHLVFFGRRTRPIRLLWWVTLNQHLRLDLLINRFVNLIDNHVTGFRFLSFNSGERSHSDCSLLSHFCWRLFRFYKRETTLACWTWVNFSCLWFSGTRRQASVVCMAWGELRSVDSSKLCFLWSWHVHSIQTFFFLLSSGRRMNGSKRFEMTREANQRTYNSPRTES